MRFIILNDLHLGASGTGIWHNRFMLDYATTIVRSAVAAINKHKPDRVFILGDITNEGTEPQLELAREILSDFEVPWFTIPGNHDRPGMESGNFGRIFAGHIPPAIEAIDQGMIAFLKEKIPQPGSDEPIIIDPADIHAALEVLVNTKPQFLLVFSHFQLLSEQPHALAYDGNYVSHYLDGQAAVHQMLKHVQRKIIAFCGHQHWHHVTHDERFIQVTNASMIEYPLEYRQIELLGNQMCVTTFETASPQIAKKSLISNQWVRGKPEERAFELTLY